MPLRHRSLSPRARSCVCCHSNFSMSVLWGEVSCVIERSLMVGESTRRRLGLLYVLYWSHVRSPLTLHDNWRPAVKHAEGGDGVISRLCVSCSLGPSGLGKVSSDGHDRQGTFRCFLSRWILLYWESERGTTELVRSWLWLSDVDGEVMWALSAEVNIRSAMIGLRLWGYRLSVNGNVERVKVPEWVRGDCRLWFFFLGVNNEFCLRHFFLGI